MSRSYEQWIEHLSTKPLPKHVGIVPDGNGRWATLRGLPRPLGHRAGVETLKVIVKAAVDLGLECLTLYSFSTENWSRSNDEVSGLMGLLIEYLDSGIADNIKLGVRVRVIGRREGLRPNIRAAIARAETETARQNRMNLVVAFNYGGRAEIVDAVRDIARRVKDGSIAPEDITEETVGQALYTAGLKDPDMIIRTSGELRMSNFLLWQSAYAEFVPSPVLWPDFTPQEFFARIEQYQDRDRRFGGVKRTGVSSC